MAEENEDTPDQAEIEELLASTDAQPPPSGAAAETDAPDGSDAGADPADQTLQEQSQGQLSSPAAGAMGETGAPDELLNQAEADLAAALNPNLDEQSGGLEQFGEPAAFNFQPFEEAKSSLSPAAALDSLEDVELDLRIELGRAELLIEEVLELREGSVVPLDKLAGDPVDILVNGQLVARGEVLVLNDNFCVRVAEILTPES